MTEQRNADPASTVYNAQYVLGAQEIFIEYNYYSWQWEWE